jgi:hypothetical protein
LAGVARHDLGVLGQARDRGCVCLDCGEPLSVDVLDGVIQRADPEGIAFYADVSVKKWYSNLPCA